MRTYALVSCVTLAVLLAGCAGRGDPSPAASVGSVFTFAPSFVFAYRAEGNSANANLPPPQDSANLGQGIQNAKAKSIPVPRQKPQQTAEVVAANNHYTK